MTHTPVLLEEVLEALSPQDNETYIDATFGGGGYSKAFLQKSNCKIIAFDRDLEATKRAKILKEEFGDRFEFYHDCFSNLHRLSSQKLDIKGIVFDFGVSSYQLDDASRGFSFRHDGFLDMRMNQGEDLDAYKVVNTFSKDQLEQIIHFYGEEPRARHVANAIVEHRKKSPIKTTAELAQIVRKFAHHKSGIDSATLTFQGIRIFVNNELQEIEKGLQSAFDLLSTNGKLLAVTFHSLEDRVVKDFFKKINNSNINIENSGTIGLRKVNNKAIKPSVSELRNNARSRSAKLRAYFKSKGI